MTQRPPAAPGPAPSLRATDRRRVRLALRLTCVGFCAGLGLLGAGAAHPPTAALSHVEPVAFVAPDDFSGLDDNVATGQDSPGTWADPPVPTAGSAPMPSLAAVDDPPNPGPPPAMDPEVARLLAQLREDAKGSPQDPRPGAEALAAVDFALRQVGLPYLWGAVGPDAYDCSGLTWRAYERAGVVLPRVSADQHAFGGTPVAIADLLPGDLVFFATVAWDPGVVHHVGMYVGQGLMVDAPHPGAFVRVEPVTATGYVGAVRVVAERRPVLASTPGPVVPSPSTGPTTPTPTPTPTPSESGAPSDPGTASPSPTDPPTDPTTDPTADPTADPPPGDAPTSPDAAPATG